MQIVAQFDPTVTRTVTNGIGGTFNTNANGANRLVIANESNVSLLLYFPNGESAYLPAWTSRLFCMSMPSGTVTWIQEQILSSANPPISQVYVEAYQPSEHLPETYPAALVRQTNIGNSTPLSTSANSITNTGNAAATAIVTAQVLADGSNAVLITNDAQVTLGDATHNAVITVIGKTSLDNGAFKTDGNGNITAQDILFDGHLGVSASADRLDANSSTTYLKGSANVIIQVPNGTSITTTNGNGLTLNTGHLTFSDGSTLSRFHTFTGSGTGTFNHNNGKTPDNVQLTTGQVVGTQTMGFDSLGSSTVHVDTGASLAWYGVAWSFI